VHNAFVIVAHTHTHTHTNTHTNAHTQKINAHNPPMKGPLKVLLRTAHSAHRKSFCGTGLPPGCKPLSHRSLCSAIHCSRCSSTCASKCMYTCVRVFVSKYSVLTSKLHCKMHCPYVDAARQTESKLHSKRMPLRKASCICHFDTQASAHAIACSSKLSVHTCECMLLAFACFTDIYICLS
jgi:hypothetical protein